jgi:hypothetical protein
MPCSGPSGAVAERPEGAVSVAYVLQDLLTTTDVRTRMAQLGKNEADLAIARLPGRRALSGSIGELVAARLSGNDLVASGPMRYGGVYLD